jgi:hypothetical protein
MHHGPGYEYSHLVILYPEWPFKAKRILDNIIYVFVLYYVPSGMMLFRINCPLIIINY